MFEKVMVDPGFKSLSLLATTLTFLCGVSASVLATPSPSEESMASGSVQTHSVFLEHSIHPLTAQSEPKPQFVQPSNMEFSTTRIADALPSPVTTPKIQTLDIDQTKTTILMNQSSSGETRILDRDRSISTKAANLGTVIPSFTAAQATASSFTIAQADGMQVAPRSSGPYVSLSGGYQSREQAGEDPVTFVDFNGGYIFNGAVGYRFGNFRTDVEVSFWDSDIEGVSAAATGLQPGDGNVTGRAFMLNVYYDIPIRNSPFKPYLGGGIGIYRTRIHDLTNDVLASLPAAFGGPLIVEDERSNEVFAFQLRAGIAYAISQSFDVFLGYRYFNGSTLTFTDTIFGTLKPNGAKLHSVELGVRLLF